jgi:hypothetical protein
MRISVYDHAFAGVAPKVYVATSLAQWLIEHYGPVCAKTLSIYEGEPSGETEISNNFEAIRNASGERYTILENPGTGIEWLPIVKSLLVSVAVSVVSRMLAPDPKMPGNVNRTSASPNNSLGARENQVRYLQRVEDIFGTVKAIPSLMMTTYTKYVASRQVEYAYYCISRGYLDVSEVKDGETYVSSITGASAAVYRPFTSPNSGDAPQLLIGAPIIDNIVSVRRSVETDGFTLKAYNQIQLSAAARYKFIPGSSSGYGGNDVLEQKEKKPNFNAIAEVGQTITIAPFDMSYTRTGDAECVGADRKYIDLGVVPSMFTGVRPGDQVTFSDWFSPQNNGTFTVATKAPDDSFITVTSGSQVDETRVLPTQVTVVGTPDLSSFSGTRTIIEVRDGSVVLSGTVFAYELDLGTGGAFVSASVANGLSDWTDWITLREADRTQVWFNIIAPMGLYADAGGKSVVTVDFQIEIEKLDGSMSPTGIVETVMGSIGGAVSDLIGETVERVTAWPGASRTRMRRTTPYLYDYPGTIVDEIKWADLYSVSPVNKAHFGNKTTIHTVTQATQRATAVRSRQLNCIASRLLPKWTGSGFSGAFDAEGRHVSGTIEATSYIHEIIAALCLDPKIGNRQLAELDMVQMQSQTDLAYAMHPTAPTFNFTFDNDGTSLEEAVEMVANAGFCTAYRQSGKIRLAFDRAQDSAVALFTHRNKRPNSETFARSFANDADYDGVEFVYQDPDTQQAESIILPLVGGYTKLKKFEIPGIRNYPQAWLRACREFAKIQGQRITGVTDVTTDARALLPNSRIDLVDNTRMKSFDGDVRGQVGLVLTLSRDVEFEPGEDHSILLMQRDGTPESILCFEVPGSPNKVLLQHAPAEALELEGGADGIRTIFSFASDSARQRQAFLVKEIGVSDGQYMQLTVVNYSVSFYAADTEPIPPRDSVIN